MGGSSIRIVAGIALLTAIAACSDNISAPAEHQRAYAPGLEQATNITEIVALSRNMYIGANVDAVIVALANGDPADDLPALFSAIANLQSTDFPSRARAMAEEIVRLKPHFVGLQEASDINIQIPPLGVSLNIDFMAVLRQELAARGLNYVVAGQVSNASVVLNPIPGSTIEVIDFDVVLVDASRVTFNPASVIAQNFSTNIGVLAPGINVVRGYVALNATVNGESFTVANTHLESGNSNPVLPFLRAAQAMELVTVIGGASSVVLMGDFNDVVGSPMYQVIAGAGFSDAWAEKNGSADGFTCCFLPDLTDKTAAGLSQRIDYVFYRGAATDVPKPLWVASLVGEGMNDRIHVDQQKIWPSDHAGVLAAIPFPR
jgi:hypothetical protein